LEQILIHALISNRYFTKLKIKFKRLWLANQKLLSSGQDLYQHIDR